MIRLIVGSCLAAAAIAAAYFGSRMDQSPTPNCTAELRSWVVAGRGRHLYLQISCQPPYKHLSGRVEFTEARLRSDYVPVRDPDFVNRVVKMNRGLALRPPFFGRDDNKLEATYILSPEQAACLQADRLYSRRYQLVGSNSTSAMRGALQSCGLALPDTILRGGGVLGRYPGVDSPIGELIAPPDWPQYGFPDGPEPIPVR